MSTSAKDGLVHYCHVNRLNGDRPSTHIYAIDTPPDEPSEPIKPCGMTDLPMPSNRNLLLLFEPRFEHHLQPKNWCSAFFRTDDRASLEDRLRDDRGYFRCRFSPQKQIPQSEPLIYTVNEIELPRPSPEWVDNQAGRYIDPASSRSRVQVNLIGLTKITDPDQIKRILGKEESKENPVYVLPYKVENGLFVDQEVPEGQGPMHGWGTGEGVAW